MSKLDPCCTIDDIKVGVEQRLSSFFNAMAAEFPGGFPRPENIDEIVGVFLAIKANHKAEDIQQGFGINDTETCGKRYEEAVSILSRNNLLFHEVFEVGGSLGIPTTSLSLF